MIAAVLQLAVFLGSAWLLSRAVDWCYRRNEPSPPPPEPVLHAVAPSGPRRTRPPGPPIEPTPVPAALVPAPTPTPTPTPMPVGSRS
jgi:hypothetical protein